MSALELVDPSERELVALRMRKVMEEGRASVEGHLVAKDGAKTPFFFSGHRVEFAGSPCLLGMGLDLTDLKRTEQRLRLSEARKAAILEASLGCIITIDHTERVLEFNPAAERTFGYQRAEVLGQKMSTLIIPPARQADHRNGIKRCLETGHGPVLGRRIEISAVRADGSEFPAEISIVGTVLDGRHVFTGYLRDITERRRIEEEVRQLNADLESRVAARTAELAAANVRLQAEVAERIVVEEGYRRAKIAAESATKAKDEFLAMMSHELRTPLNGVIGMVELLADSELDGRQRRYAEVARASADSLLDVINDIPDLSRIESGKLELDPTEFKPSVVVEEVSTALALRDEEKGLELAFQVAPEVDTWVTGDRGRLRQVLTDLVSNAIKYTERGEVVVRAGVEDAAGVAGLVRLRVTVIDTGIGIPDDLRGRLFRPFTQADASTTRRARRLAVLDLDRALERLGGDRELFRQLLEIQKGELPKLVADVREGFRRRDVSAVSFAAHRLCGLAKSFDAHAAARAAGTLEDAATSGDLDAVSAAVTAFLEEFDLLREALDVVRLDT